MTDYQKWEAFSSQYDSDGDEKNLNLQVPLEHVSDSHLVSGKVDPKDITMSCGKPMTREEFERYCSTRGIQPKIMKQN
jgi:hypothetical protein